MMESRGKALSHLRKSLRSGRGEEMPMKKVSIIAADEKGLEEGLEKAKEILPTIEKAMGEIEPKMEESEDSEEESMESPEHEDMESKVESEESSEELAKMSHDELVKMVQSLKSRLNY